MSDGELIRAARASWDKHFSRPPLAMGVEQGIVWATVAAPSTGVNGYALIPAEGHPWSAGFPRDEDSNTDAERSRKNLRLFSEIQKRRGDEDMGEIMREAMEHPDYEEHPKDYGLDDFLDAHGGITYYQHPWVGFDTAHAWDIWEPEYDPSGLSARFRSVDQAWDIHWIPEMVAEEAKKLARQISEIAVLERQLELRPEEAE